MANPVFLRLPDSLEFSKGLQFPLTKTIEMVQAIDRTAGGVLQVEDLGPPIRCFILRFKLLPEVDYNGLKNWFEYVAQGALNSFTFYDEDARDYTIRILSDKLDFPEVQHQRYSGDLLVEEIR